MNRFMRVMRGFGLRAPGSGERSPVRLWRRCVAAGGAVSLFLAALSSVPVAATASCFGHECDSSTRSYGCDPADGEKPCCFGSMIGDQWQSSEQDALWLNYPANATIILNLRAWTDAVPESAFSTVQITSAQGSQDPDRDADPPDAPINPWTNASGSEAQWGTAKPGLISVENATCSPWFARVVVGFDPPLDGGPIKKGPCWKAQLSKSP
jgi:hypothetical protein